MSLNGYTYRTTVAAYGDVFMLPLSVENRRRPASRPAIRWK